MKKLEVVEFNGEKWLYHQGYKLRFEGHSSKGYWNAFYLDPMNNPVLWYNHGDIKNSKFVTLGGYTKRALQRRAIRKIKNLIKARINEQRRHP